MEKRFYKSKTDKKLAGVCAGVAEYFEVDPTLVRLIWVVFTFAGGAGILAYIIAAIIMPEAPNGNQPEVRKKKPKNQPHKMNDNAAVIITEVDEEQNSEDFGEAFGEEYREEREAEYEDGYEEEYVTEDVEEKKDKNSMVLGVVLILIGLMFFSRNFFKWFWIDFSYLWPILLILLGVVMVVNKRK